MAYYKCIEKRKEDPKRIYSSSSMETICNATGCIIGDYYILIELAVSSYNSSYATINCDQHTGMNIILSKSTRMYHQEYGSVYLFLYTHIFIATSSSITYVSSSNGYKEYQIYKI